jgi:hypothetical protein
MEKNTEHEKAKDEENPSEQAIWWTIRYLDPDVKDEATDGGLIITITSLAVFVIVYAVVAVLYSRGW